MASFPRSTEMRIRKAVVGDIRHIHRLLNRYAEQGLLLARPLSNSTTT